MEETVGFFYLFVAGATYWVSFRADSTRMWKDNERECGLKAVARRGREACGRGFGDDVGCVI